MNGLGGPRERHTKAPYGTDRDEVTFLPSTGRSATIEVVGSEGEARRAGTGGGWGWRGAESARENGWSGGEEALLNLSERKQARRGWEAWRWREEAGEGVERGDGRRAVFPKEGEPALGTVRAWRRLADQSRFYGCRRRCSDATHSTTFSVLNSHPSFSIPFSKTSLNCSRSNIWGTLPYIALFGAHRYPAPSPKRRLKKFKSIKLKFLFKFDYILQF
jgi:hypothetical protein